MGVDTRRRAVLGKTLLYIVPKEKECRGKEQNALYHARQLVRNPLGGFLRRSG